MSAGGSFHQRLDRSEVGLWVRLRNACGEVVNALVQRPGSWFAGLTLRRCTWTPRGAHVRRSPNPRKRKGTAVRIRSRGSIPYRPNLDPLRARSMHACFCRHSRGGAMGGKVRIHVCQATPRGMAPCSGFPLADEQDDFRFDSMRKGLVRGDCGRISQRKRGSWGSWSLGGVVLGVRRDRGRGTAGGTRRAVAVRRHSFLHPGSKWPSSGPVFPCRDARAGSDHARPEAVLYCGHGLARSMHCPGRTPARMAPEEAKRRCAGFSSCCSCCQCWPMPL